MSESTREEHSVPVGWFSPHLGDGDAHLRCLLAILTSNLGKVA